MSSKHLRRKQDGARKVDDRQSDDEDDVLPAKPRPNAFQLLDDENEGDEVTQLADDSADEKNEAGAVVESADGAQKKKKKKANKKKTKKTSEEVDEDDWDVLQRAFTEVTSLKSTNASAKTHNQSSLPTMRLVLKFDYKKMDADAELMAIINQAIKVKGLGRSAASSDNPKRKDLAGGRLVRPDTKHWEHFDGAGLSMDMLGDGPAREFVYRHSRTYRELQSHFWSVAESNDSNALFELLGAPQFTYHVDFNVQVAVGLMMQEQKDVAQSKLAKAIYTLEQCAHPAFRLGESRLPYKYRENRIMHIALFRHVTWLAKRSCFKSALEVCKALMSLDPRVDALGVVFIVDWLAICAKEYDWFIEFCQVAQVGCYSIAIRIHHFQSDDTFASLLQLPNILYSLALAFYQKASKEEDKTVKASTMKRANQCVSFCCKSSISYSCVTPCSPIRHC